jgi:hypothetical protein
MNPDPAERRLTAILSADVAGYSRLMPEDEAARAALRKLLRVSPDASISRLILFLAAADPEFLDRWADGLGKTGMKE